MMPDEILAAIEDRFLQQGAPRNLTLLFPMMVERTRGSVGGIGTGLDRLAHVGLLRRLIGGSYSRLSDSRFNRLVTADAVEAYNLPMGTIFQLMRCAAGRQLGLVTSVGIGTFVDPREQGGRMNGRTTSDLAEVIVLKNREQLFYPVIPVDVALIRGTTADEKGNISLEDEAFSLGVLYHAMAAKNSGGIVVVQVQRLAEYGSIPAKAVRIPACLVDGVVVDDPAKHDYVDENAPAISGRFKQPVPIPAPELNVRTIVSRRALAEMEPGMVVNLGAGIGMYDLPMVAVALGRVRDFHFTVEQGPLGGIPGPGGIARNPDACMDSLEVFDFYDGGGIDVACLSYAEVDQDGNVNVSRFGNSMPGAGGFINITQAAKKILYCGTLTTKGLEVACEHGRLRIVSEGKIKRFVDHVGQKTFSAMHSPLDRQAVLYITERCVFRLERGGPVLTEVAPGIDLDRDIRGQVDFAIRLAGAVKTMDAELFREW
jgi:propionate CoA-transferase